MIPETTRATLDSLNQISGDELREHGLTQVARDQNPDLVVFSLMSTTDVEAVTYTCVPGYYWYDYWYYVWDPCAWIETWVVSYTEGSVVVALADPVREDVVFGGLIQGIVDDSSMQARTEEITDAIERVFNEYPVDLGP